MQLLSRLERDSRLDQAVAAGQRAARLIRPGKVRAGLHGVWLGHPLHPVLVQIPVGAWLSASIVDLLDDDRSARRLTAAGLAAAVPAAMAGAGGWGGDSGAAVCAAAIVVAMSLYGVPLLARGPRLGRALRLAGLASAAASGLAGGHISFRLAGGANHAEAVPHLVAPGWHHLMRSADLPEGRPVRELLGEVPVVAVRVDGSVSVLADRCSHMSGPLSGGELTGGCLTCPWHGSVFRLADGSVARGPATAPQPAFLAREVGGAIQVCLPGAG